MSAERQKELKEFIKRRHPLFEAMEAHWLFLEQTYEGGRDWFSSNIFKYLKEGEVEYSDRVGRAYRFNHTREVVDLVDKYLFKMEIHRDVSRAPDSVKRFWQSSTLNELSIKDFMKRVSNRASVLGRPWIVVDNDKANDAVTVADEKKNGARTYAYIVPAQHALDMSYDDQNNLNWILIYEMARDDDDAIKSSGNLIDRYRLWTRTSSKLFEVQKEGNKVVIVESEEIMHNLGVVPVIPGDNIISDSLWSSPAMIADVAYLDRAVANYLSNLDAIIQDQTFSQLIIPSQALDPGTDSNAKLVEIGTKRIFTYDAEAASGAKPEYISPDPKQAEIVLKVISKIINEIYHSIGLAGERTKEDNSAGIDNSSGVAKAYDFERVNSLLAAKADSLQRIENKMAWLVAKWHQEESSIKTGSDDLVVYPDNFDVRGLYDEFDIAARLSLIEAPDEVRREQMNTLIDKLFPQLKEDLLKKMQSELKSWPPKLVLDEPGSKGPSVLGKAAKNSMANKLVKE